MGRGMTRREVLQGAALASLGFWVGGTARAAGGDKLRIGAIGCGGRGAGDIDEVKGEHIQALCDVDWRRAAGKFKEFPDAPKYRDFREMLDNEPLDAVTIATPDHTHAVAAMAALQLGLHVYCEKPLTRTVHEARALREAAAGAKVATQMGNQGSATDGQRQSVEILQSGAIGTIKEVHVWTDRPIWPQGIDRPADTPSVPKDLNWDLWLGPSPERDYNPAYLPFVWRGWYDFGTGALGDMGCHNCNMAFRAMKLGYPTAVQATLVSDRHPETFPRAATVKYDFPAREGLPPLTLFWHDGNRKPDAELAYGADLPDNGTLVVGDKGVYLGLDSHCSRWALLPKQDFDGYEPPEPTLPRSPGHHAEWIQACKGGPPAFSNFGYAAFLTEVMVLGALAERVMCRIEWDGPNMCVTNCAEAQELVEPPYRNGWSL